MNAKRAKALRKLVRVTGEDPRAASYVETDRRVKVFDLPRRVLGEDGRAHVEYDRVQLVTSTVRVSPHCGRGAYRHLKRIAA